MANTSQTGIRKTTKLFEEEDVFRGLLGADQASIDQYDFQISGYYGWCWTSMPAFMEQTEPEMTSRFKNYTEKGTTSFDGIQDMTVETGDVTGGIAGNSMKVVTGLKDDFDSFTMHIYEQLGSLVREFITSWAYGTFDPKYGYATYNGLIDTIDGGFSAKNHTAELLYWVTDPSNSVNGIEYACLISNIFPTKVPKSHLNGTHGEHNVVDFDLEFTGIKSESAWINELACKALAAQRTIKSCFDFVPSDTTLYNF